MSWQRCIVSLGLALCMTASAAAQGSVLAPKLSGIAFLVGSWDSGVGKVAETGGTSRGSSTVSLEAGGAVLLRRDHTELFGADGKPSGAFDQIMMIYPEGDTLHADYSDGTHVIHYASAAVVAGVSVTFSTAPSSESPTFRLRYEKADSTTLAVTFEMAPPGQSAFRPVASGTLRKSI